MDADFSIPVRVTHFFNFLFLSLLIRSGIELLGAHPKLYWRDHCSPGSEWLRLARKKLPVNEPWTAEDETKPLSPWLALPGRNNLGLGRHWHFWSVTGWLVCGIVYAATIAATSEWQRLVPTSWSIVPRAWEALVTYVQFEIPADAHPYNALQQLTYFSLIFVLTPLQIVSGLAMSPALGARFPRASRLLGGRQAARSVHFLGLVCFCAFFVVHVSMVIAHGFGEGMSMIVLGGEDQRRLAVLLGLVAIAFVIVVNVLATGATLRKPALVKRLLEIGIDPLKRLLFHHLRSRQNHGSISDTPRVNGRVPRNEAYVQSRAARFEDWRLRIDGLVDAPLCLTLADLRAMPAVTQSTLHVCIQGWTYFASWKGVSIAHLLELVRPKPAARFLVFRTLDEKWEHPGHGDYYEVIDLETARAPQVILAYDMNGAPLPVEHGAPLRLRVEHQLGYKMAKWVHRIELVEDFRGIGLGQGGWRDDVLNYYPSSAGI
jgi:methionine sulfoxide reductase catalytic subunit